MKCTYCENELDKEESKNPRTDSDGDIICDECFHEEYEEVCPLCGDYFEKGNPQEGEYYFAITKNDDCRVQPGVYVAVTFPFYIDNMFTQRVITNNVEKVGDLEGNDLNVWRGGRICLECVKKYGKEK